MIASLLAKRNYWFSSFLVSSNFSLNKRYRNRRGNADLTMERNSMATLVHTTQDYDKQNKYSTICVKHYYIKTSINDVNKTRAYL